MLIYFPIPDCIIGVRDAASPKSEFELPHTFDDKVISLKDALAPIAATLSVKLILPSKGESDTEKVMVYLFDPIEALS